jgi:flavin reductase (DIM6/NTAB) family NADH-FMN oxidoreductase RutF
MEIDFNQITAYQRYKLMASLIVPRPIALVTTIGANGVVNAAPFSMFNMMGEDPPIVMISINRKQGIHQKDTATNILANEEFVVHLCDEATHVGFTSEASKTVAPPRIAQAPVAFECVLHEKIVTESRYIFIGKVQWLSVREGLVDTETWRVRLQDYHPVGRFGASFYVTTRDRFAIEGNHAEARTTPIDEI